MKNIYEKFNFTQKYKNQLTDFLKINTTIESGGNKIFDGSYNHIMHIPEELADLIFYLKRFQKNNKKIYKNYLEIGFNNGIMNTLFYKFFKFQKIVAIDPLGPHIKGDIMTANLRFKNMVLICQNSSSNFVKELLSNMEKFDIIFIDGDHSYQSVKKDLRLSLNLIKSSGIIIMHDIFVPDSGPKKLWLQIKKKFNTKEISYLKHNFKFGYGIIEI